ncbi:MAG: aminoacyl-tRNA hydrolase [Desulfobacterota bacterium]|nr:aminoacyl-tRNA hydrolase [Thermodesulfobacteriota bacterium]MDW8002125.1 aminoacyl-tRNA hydrolase [Deltaproteobacteria bacterium]
MLLVCGLGNSDLTLRNTRHNTGYFVIEKLSEKFKVSLDRVLESCLIGISDEVILAKPQSFMNLSGGPIVRLLRKLGLTNESLVLVHDDMDLKFGELKIKWDGGDGGHRGVRSVIEHIGTKEFLRVKVGIGRPKNEPPEEYVLSPFTEEERKILPEILERAAMAVETVIREGRAKAMSIFNRKWSI